MYRVQQRHNSWRMKWPWRQSPSYGVSERFCRECGLAYHDGPLPSEVIHFDSRSVSTAVYPAGSFRGNDLIVRIGRVRAGGHQLYLSEFIPATEVEDVLSTVSDLKSWLSQSGRQVANRR